MIIGTGIDIVKIDRIEKLYNKFGEKFLLRIFTAHELEYLKKRKKKKFISGLALRFAAKEAFLKAIKTGLSGDFRLNDIEVLNDELGAPFLRLHRAAKGHLEALNVKNTHIALSDDGDYAIANVTLEG